jgi:hypothetical protein
MNIEKNSSSSTTNDGFQTKAVLISIPKKRADQGHRAILTRAYALFSLLKPCVEKVIL